MNVTHTTRTFVVVDLVGYTALTDTHGDERAAELATSLTAWARAALSADDQLVKSMGDGILVTSRDPNTALTFVRTLQKGLRHDNIVLAIRASLHHGSAVEVDGDYFGATVNIAARLLHEARPGQVVASDEVARVVAKTGESVREIGPVQVRHIAEPITIHSIDAGGDPPKLDPVCHMILGPDAVTIQWDGRIIGFCSDDCARRFAQDPTPYEDHLDSC